jgi:hypothetical protein
LVPVVMASLVKPHSSIEVRVASNHPVLPRGHISFVPRCEKRPVITPVGWLNRKYCLHLGTLGFVTILRNKCFQVFN